MLQEAHVTELRDAIVGSIWDAYKDAHGIRPRWIDFASMSIAELQELESSTYDEVLEAIKQEESWQAEAIVRFEAKIAELIEIGAGDRETAMRWIKDAEEDWYDDGMFEYETGLPYGYLAEKA